MKSKVIFLTITAVLLMAAPVFAQAPDATAGIGRGELTRLGALIGMGLAAGLCGTGQGEAVGSAAEGIARNPGAQARPPPRPSRPSSRRHSLAAATAWATIARSSSRSAAIFGTSPGSAPR